MDENKLPKVAWLEGTKVRVTICEIIHEDEKELVIETLQRRMRIMKQWLVKIEEPLPENANEKENGYGKTDQRSQSQ